jgi:hypothetical protein
MRWLREWWQNRRRRQQARRDPAVGLAEALLQKSGALWLRRDPCMPGGCQLLVSITCRHCQRRLYECESVRLSFDSSLVSGVCATCAPFIKGGLPDGWLVDDVCSHGKPLWQTCEQCKADEAPPDDSLKIER